MLSSKKKQRKSVDLPVYAGSEGPHAVILGTGGDGSNGGTGTFFEGAVTIGNPST